MFTLSTKTFTGLVNLAAGANIASAATINLSTATGNCPRITGTTATSAVTMNTGQQMLVVADGAWPLTYHATTNKLNTGGQNYTCAAGDVILYHKDLSGVVHGRIVPGSGAAPGQRFSAISFSRDLTAASGTQACTGFGGTPRAVIIMAGRVDGANAMHSVGISDGVVQASLVANWEGSGLDLLYTGGVIGFYETESVRQLGAISSFSADTVTISWTKTGSPSAGTGTFTILALL